MVLLCLAPAAARLFHGKGHWAQTMDVDMRPEVVSQLLSTVEAKWTQEAVNVLSNQAVEAIAFGAMEGSCVKVSSAVVQGSDGDRLRVIEYMKTVCGEPNAKSNIEMCTNFGNAIQEFMIGDNVYNREQLDMHGFCHKFWNTYVKPAGEAAKKKLDAEEDQILAAEKKREEDEVAQRKKLAEEAALKKLREAVAQNNTSLNVAARWNAHAENGQNASEVTTTTSTTTSTTSSTTSSTTTSNATASSEIASTPAPTAQNSTSAVKSLLVHNATVLQNATVQKEQTQQSVDQTFTMETVSNQTQLQNTTNLVLTNTSAFQAQITNATAVQGKLTDKVIKQLKFVLNHTKRNTQNITANSTNITS